MLKEFKGHCFSDIVLFVTGTSWVWSHTLRLKIRLLEDTIQKKSKCRWTCIKIDLPLIRLKFKRILSLNITLLSTYNKMFLWIICRLAIYWSFSRRASSLFLNISLSPVHKQYPMKWSSTEIERANFLTASNWEELLVTPLQTLP